jgi:N-acetylglucosaminyl-diphospho-decaprenol L-rhamnosyltransferase
MRLALAIINYNTVSDLRACLSSVRDNLGDIRTVVVDNGSSDGSREMVVAEFPWAHLEHNPGNPGYASACNRALRSTSEPYVFILNSDVEFVEDGLEEILDYMDCHPDVGVLGPMVLNSDGTVQMSCRRFPSMLENVVHGFLGEIWRGNPFTISYHMKGIERRKPCNVDWVSGAAMLLRRDAAEKMGGFDEVYFMYVEDVDLCWRMRQGGYGAVYHPAFRLIHHIGSASSQQSLRMLYQHHRSMYIFFRKRYRGWKGLALTPLIVVGLAARFILELMIRLLRAARHGCRWHEKIF